MPFFKPGTATFLTIPRAAGAAVVDVVVVALVDVDVVDDDAMLRTAEMESLICYYRFSCQQKIMYSV